VSNTPFDLRSRSSRRKHDELGLVNMKGRVYDPKLGRFLTTDPIVANLFSGQSFNSYAYVLGNPLSYVDPSGFQPSDVNEPGVLVMPTAFIQASPSGRAAQRPGGEPSPTGQIKPKSEAAEVGAAAPPTDVDTTGSWFAPDPSLPIVELPHATGPGSDDPFGIKPPPLAVSYDRPLSLLEQLVSGEQSGGRTTIMLALEPGLLRDLGIALAADDLHVVTLRRQITEFLPPSPREAALGRMAGVAIPMVAAALTPGPVDDLALAAGAAGYTTRQAGNIVYRGIAAGENPAAGLMARAPGAGNSVASHVAGQRASQWISTTKSLEVAQSRFGQHGVVAIDLSKVPGTVVDVSGGIPGLAPNTMLSRWAAKMQEVLIQNAVPAKAITVIK
jgi:RHS repeat-associated protein